VTQPNGPNESVQQEILKLYKSSPEVSILFELMTDFDEGLQEWRYRHIKLVERTIGAKKGTGGSPGVPFLKESLFKPIFHDLWGIRHECSRGAARRGNPNDGCREGTTPRLNPLLGRRGEGGELK